MPHEAKRTEDGPVTGTSADANARILRVRLDACDEVDGRIMFDGRPLTGVAFAPKRPEAGHDDTPPGLLEALRYENGMLAGNYVEPLLDNPDLPILEASPSVYDEFGLNQVLFDGRRFDGIVVDFDGAHLARLTVVDQGDAETPSQIVGWAADGSLRFMHRRDQCPTPEGLTLVRQFVQRSEENGLLDPGGTHSHRLSISLAAGFLDDYDRVRLFPDEDTATKIFSDFPYESDNFHASAFTIGCDGEGRVNLLSTIGDDFFDYLNQQQPAFEPIVDIPRSWHHVIAPGASRHLELRLQPTDLDAIVATADGYDWFHPVEELMIGKSVNGSPSYDALIQHLTAHRPGLVVTSE